jgi:hypothetical protein
MSKMDELRAMREARYENAAVRVDKRYGPAEPDTALCGHRAISGRTCTREAGHTAKSHRYA